MTTTVATAFRVTCQSTSPLAVDGVLADLDQPNDLPPMAHTFLPAPEDPDCGHGHPALRSPLDDQALQSFLLGSRTRPADTDPARPAADTDPNTLSAGRPAEDEPTGGHERLRYLPMLSCCYAVVLYDVASPRLVRRIVGMFPDPDQADSYARDSGYRLYDVVPATAVTPALP
jgi:hypothetical protein